MGMGFRLSAIGQKMPLSLANALGDETTHDASFGLHLLKFLLRPIENHSASLDQRIAPLPLRQTLLQTDLPLLDSIDNRFQFFHRLFKRQLVRRRRLIGGFAGR